MVCETPFFTIVSVPVTATNLTAPVPWLAAPPRALPNPPVDPKSPVLDVPGV